MKTFKVEGRLTVNIEFTDLVKAENEEQAGETAVVRILAGKGLDNADVLDEEVHAEEI